MMYVFGLYDEQNIIVGVCVFSPAPSRFWNNGGTLFNNKHEINTIELSRLCLIDNHEKNLTSFFVSGCLNLLPKPNVVISYADTNNNHCGYIYQATNFIYTGEAKPAFKSKDWYFNGKKYHGRNMDLAMIKKLLGDKYNPEISFHENIISNGGQIISQQNKHRYIYINAKNKKQLIQDMIYKSQPYPKTQNKNYDASFEPAIQFELF